MPPAAKRLGSCRELRGCQRDEPSDTAGKPTLIIGFNCSPPKSKQQLNRMQQNQGASRMERLGKQVWKQHAFVHRSTLPLLLKVYLSLFCHITFCQGLLPFTVLTNSCWMLPSSHTATVSGWNLCLVLALPHKSLFIASQLSCKDQLAGPASKPKG